MEKRKEGGNDGCGDQKNRGGKKRGKGKEEEERSGKRKVKLSQL